MTARRRGLAVLRKTGKDSWAALDGTYRIERIKRPCGHATETVYKVKTRRYCLLPRTANCETLAGAREAVTAWEASRGTSWYPPGGAR